MTRRRPPLDPRPVLGALVLVAAGGSAQPIPELGCDDPGPLSRDTRQELRELRARQREALAVFELGSAIDLQHRIVRLNCSNPYEAYVMAELLLRADRTEEAVAWLERLYDREINDLEERLADPVDPLHVLRDTPEFRASGLAQKIAVKRSAHEERRALAMARLAALPPDRRPPDAYVARDVCPFECCAYQEWTVLEDTDLFAAPHSTTRVAIARKGTTVLGLTGNVYLRPTPVLVVHPAPTYSPEGSVEAGEIVFLLDRIGEGYQHVWHRGRVTSMSTFHEVREHCPFPGDGCWGELLAPETERDSSTWWVRVRLADGVEGWTREIHFGNIDGCS